MKKATLITLILFAFVLRNSMAQNVAINSTGSSPSGNAMLEVEQSNTGTSRTKMGLNVLMPTSSELTSPAISVKGYSPAIELMDKDGVQNWFIGIDDNDNNKVLFGRGYGPGQDIDPAMVITTSDYVGIGTISPSSLLQVGSAATSQIAPGIGTYGQFAMLASQQLLSFGLSDSEPWASWIQSSNPNTSGALPLVLNPSGGNVGIGTDSPSYTLDVAGDFRATGEEIYFPNLYTFQTQNYSDLRINPSNGRIAVEKSSKRYKENIKDMEDVGWIYNLRPVNFNLKVDPEKGKAYGLIAEEVAEVAPEFVFYKDNVIEGVTYSKFISPLIKVVQVQKKSIENLENQITAQQQQIDELKSQNTDNINHLRAEIENLKKAVYTNTQLTDNK